VLTIVSGTGDRTEFGFQVDGAARPCAFHLAPVQDPRNPQGWMLFELEGDGLRLGFHDNLKRRAAGFDARPDMVVLTLTRRKT
jgi:hypothetical protein